MLSMPNPLVTPQDITVNWTGTAPLVAGALTLKPGETTMPLAAFHGLGAYPKAVEALASGALAVVHREHRFADGDKHCIGCSITREEVAAARAEESRKAKAAKAAAAPETPAKP